MYTRYNRYCGCCNQNNIDNQVLENVCDDVNQNAVQYSNTPCYYQKIDNSMSCGCGFDEDMNLFPNNPMLAQSYVPMQYMDKTFTPCCGLKMGTIFPELVSPYRPGQSMEFNDYLRARNEIGEGCNR